MTGEIVPLVLVPRFTGYVGAQEFTSVPIDTTPFLGGSVTLWRGPILGDSATFLAFFEVSSDLDTWVKEPETSEGETGYNPSVPGDAGALTIGIPFPRRWLRIRIVLGGTDPAVTCWCAGNVQLRVN